VTDTSIGTNLEQTGRQSGLCDGTGSIRQARRLGVMAALSAVAMLGLAAETAGAQNARIAAVSAKPAELSSTGTAAPGGAQNARGAAVSAKPSDKPSERSSSRAAAPAVAPKTLRLAGRYFVDFRARTAASYGHAFLWYGRLNERGKVGAIEVAGLHPASDSVIPYIVGHVIPVLSETGKSYGDLDEQYLTANYRVYLSEADSMKVFAYIQHLQATRPLWLASVYNCTAFLADVASFMGLRTPPTPAWIYPEDFVNKLREINGGRQEIILAATP
jgi:hypothetical protein